MGGNLELAHAFPGIEIYGSGGCCDRKDQFLRELDLLGGKGIGLYNYSNTRNDKFDALAAQSSVEADPAKREQLIRAALAEWKEQIHTVPLHRQVIPWAARSHVELVHRADNTVVMQWITLGR